jgi:ribosomal protein S18 acetylase RimI-like enzyme
VSPSDRDLDGVDRETHLVVDDTVVGRYHLYEAQPPAAELFVADVPVARAADAAVAQLAGWNLTTTDERLASELIARGARSLRYYSLLTCDLASLHEVDVTRREFELNEQQITPDFDPPPDLVTLVRRAYPMGHPDEELGTDEEIKLDVARAVRGDRLGPLMTQSRLLLDAGRSVALAIVNRVPGVAPTGGVWLTDLCRDPDDKYAGLGRSLLIDVLNDCREAGETSLSLAVTDGNPARAVYESLGFSAVATTRKVRLPG